MDLKPLSSRLLNEQGALAFILLSITDSMPDGTLPLVTVEEAGQKYSGIVQPIANARTVKDLQLELKKYETDMKAQAAYLALPDAERAKQEAPAVPKAVTVMINRVTHEEFPFMK